MGQQTILNQALFTLNFLNISAQTMKLQLKHFGYIQKYN